MGKINQGSFHFLPSCSSVIQEELSFSVFHFLPSRLGSKHLLVSMLIYSIKVPWNRNSWVNKIIYRWYVFKQCFGLLFISMVSELDSHTASVCKRLKWGNDSAMIERRPRISQCYIPKVVFVQWWVTVLFLRISIGLKDTLKLLMFLPFFIILWTVRMTTLCLCKLKKTYLHFYLTFS